MFIITKSVVFDEAAPFRNHFLAGDVQLLVTRTDKSNWGSEALNAARLQKGRCLVNKNVNLRLVACDYIADCLQMSEPSFFIGECHLQWLIAEGSLLLSAQPGVHCFKSVVKRMPTLKNTLVGFETVLKFGGSRVHFVVKTR